MKTKGKVILSALLAAVLLCLAGCGRSADRLPTGQDAAEPSPETVQKTGADGETELILYSKQEYIMPAGCSVRGVARIDDRLMIYGYQDGVPMLGTAAYEISPEGTPSFGEVKLLPLDTQSPYYSTVQGITAGADGCFYVLAGEHSPMYMSNGEYRTNDDYQGRTAILKYSPSGECLDKMEIPNWHGDNRFGIAADADGRIYIMGDNYVSSFLWQSEEITTVQNPDSMMCSIEMTAQGAVLSVLERDDYKYYLMESPDSLKALTLTNPCDVPTVEVGNISMCQGLNGEYIVSANSRFIACDLAGGGSQELYQWDYTAYPGGCNYACRLAENFFACTVGEEFLLVTGMAEQPASDKSVVNVALYDMDMSNAGGIIADLNRRGGAYQYKTLEYGKDEGQRLLADIIAGGKIDLVVFNNNLNVKSDAFEDLYPYIDNDPELSRDSFIPSILEVLSDNGQLHEIWEGVTVNTIAARAADVDGRDALSPWDYQDILAANDGYEAVFQTFMDKENMLKWVSEVGMVEYVDLGAGTCGFDDPAFGDLLSWCGMMGDEVKEGSSAPSYDISQVVLSLERISDPARLKAIGDNFGQPYVFVGFPNGGQGVSYFTCAYNGSMAIPANSANKEGAWAYIKSRLSLEVQMGIDYSLPVSLQAMLRQAEAILTPEETQQLLELVTKTAGANRCTDQQIKDIIMECGRAYLAGDKSLEDTTDLIQSRVSVYLSEQYG